MTDWRMIGVMVTVFLVWSGLLIRTIKWLIDKNLSEINRRLENLEKTGRQDSGEWQRIEREILELRAELPRDYVRRQDYIQMISSLDAKIDNIYLKIDSIRDKLVGARIQDSV